MTLLLAFQGERCVLAASDLMLLTKSEFLNVAKEHTYVTNKFRKNKNGDLLAFSGDFYLSEYSILYQKSLQDLLIAPLISDTRFRKDCINRLIYVSVADAQIYLGVTTKKLIKAPVGKLIIDCREPKHEQEFYKLEKDFQNTTFAYNPKNLRNLSESCKSYVLSHENESVIFAGYVAHLIVHGTIREITRAKGKLKGKPSAHITADGSFF
jgi:hypothetical protein